MKPAPRVPPSPALPSPLGHYTPLRYPGGKGKLAPFVKALIESNDLLDGDYVEPYCGGAAIAIELLLHEYVSHIHINDISRPVYAFWRSVLDHTEALTRLVHDTPVSVRSWDRQKEIFRHPDDHDDLTLGFATFFLNRTNRSGILNGGMIGGRDQTGAWKIDARYNAEELTRRIESIARMRRRISLTIEDARDFISRQIRVLPKKTLFYLDPPYYLKGKTLYYDYSSPEDHEATAKLVTTRVRKQKWIVSYDNVEQIRDMYRGWHRMTYGVGYSARDVREGSEVMFFCKGLVVPPATSAMRKPRSRGA